MRNKTDLKTALRVLWNNINQINRIINKRDIIKFRHLENVLKKYKILWPLK